jgi:hypothetical protein
MRKFWIFAISLGLLGVARFAPTRTSTAPQVQSFANVQDVLPCEWQYTMVGDIILEAKAQLYGIEIVAPRALPDGYTTQGGYGIFTYGKYVSKTITSKKPISLGELIKSVTPEGNNLLDASNLKVTIKRGCLEDPDQTPIEG